MPEWSNGPDSKSGVPLCGTGGSNPPLSANPFHGPKGFLQWSRAQEAKLTEAREQVKTMRSTREKDWNIPHFGDH